LKPGEEKTRQLKDKRLENRTQGKESKEKERKSSKDKKKGGRRRKEQKRKTIMERG